MEDAKRSGFYSSSSNSNAARFAATFNLFLFFLEIIEANIFSSFASSFNSSTTSTSSGGAGAEDPMAGLVPLCNLSDSDLPSSEAESSKSEPLGLKSAVMEVFSD
jgi:hypothetical protein